MGSYEDRVNRTIVYRRIYPNGIVEDIVEYCPRVESELVKRKI